MIDVLENYKESCVIIVIGISTLSEGIFFLTRYSNNVLFSDLIEKEKKGPFSINWQEYYDDVLPFYEGKNFVTEHYVEVNNFKAFGSSVFIGSMPSEDVINSTVELPELPSEIPEDYFKVELRKLVDKNAFNQIDVSSICEKYNIPTALDVYRLWLTAKKKLKIKN